MIARSGIGMTRIGRLRSSAGGVIAGVGMVDVDVVVGDVGRVRDVDVGLVDAVQAVAEVGDSRSRLDWNLGSVP